MSDACEKSPSDQNDILDKEYLVRSRYPDDIMLAAHAILREVLELDRCCQCGAQSKYFASIVTSRFAGVPEARDKWTPFIDPIVKAILAERERCAKVAGSFMHQAGSHDESFWNGYRNSVAAIENAICGGKP